MEKVTGEVVKPDDIKKALEIHNRGECSKCAFAKTPTGCSVRLTRCALAYIEQLEQGHRDMKARIEYLTETLSRYAEQTPLDYETAVSISVVWMELKADGDSLHVCRVCEDFNLEHRFHATIEFIGNARRASLPIDHYGQSWRCWRYKPTDEERRAAKWSQ